MQRLTFETQRAAGDVAQSRESAFVRNADFDLSAVTARTVVGSGDHDVDHFQTATDYLASSIPGAVRVALAELMGDLPLAMEQAAAYIDTTGSPIATYIDLVATRGEKMLGKGQVLDSRHRLTTVWDVHLDALHRDHPAAMCLLNICAYLDPDAIPLDLFTNNPDELPEPLGEVFEDPIEFVDTVGVLVGYSLVRRASETVSVHRLLQQALRRRNGELTGEQPDWRAIAQRLLFADLPTEIMIVPENWPRWRDLLPHVLASCPANHDQASSELEVVSWLLDRAATYLQVQGQPGQAKLLFERAVTIDEAALGPDHPTSTIIRQQLRDL
ncbi:DUF7779 domain-containing protein [Kutzneria sp. CA-103260]|uniref:tetratricopeptide repeat protein n=1 Tax=Kutzneria sp. CA-103260 TaxID=2802641 RepID=UPI001BEDC287|nr:hypothetical protein JJ691_48290 [Kutzneria sp. CA-103260]